MIESIDVEEKDDKQRFMNEITRRGISKLLHFTTNINVPYIFDEGFIKPRSTLETSTDVNLSNSDFLDKYRLDGKDHTNCSIERINQKMMKFKKNNFSQNDFTKFFCVLAISPKYIYRKSTIFSITNAANNYNRNTIGIDGSFEKFISLFDLEISYRDSSGHFIKITRDKEPDNIPTDIQAEVLIHDNISVNDIIQIYVETEENLRMLKSVMKVSGIRVDPNLFKCNPDIFQ